MTSSLKLDELINALCGLPGVGPKSAQRMAFYLLERHRDKARRIAKSLQDAVDNIGHCAQCQNFSEENLCTLCQSTRRQKDLLCIVESPADVAAIEQSSGYSGLYFILMGHLSPLDGIGPEQLQLHKIPERIKNSGVKEVILATNPTVEGDATAHYIAHMLKPLTVKITRIAHGVPLGGELEFIDGGTLARALTDREEL